jgi:hypothetical protein
MELWSNKVIDEKLNYNHNNPIEEGLVFRIINRNWMGLISTSAIRLIPYSGHCHQ